jgi:Ycf66 protein N-terminus
MLTSLLVWVVLLGSVGTYVIRFFLPELHRKNDVIWSGLGLFYGLMLALYADQIRGGLLLGQMAGVAMQVWFGWQTFALRRAVLAPEQRSPLPDTSGLQKLLTPILATVTTTVKKWGAQLGIPFLQDENSPKPVPTAAPTSDPEVTPESVTEVTAESAPASVPEPATEPVTEMATGVANPETTAPAVTTPEEIAPEATVSDATVSDATVPDAVDGQDDVPASTPAEPKPKLGESETAAPEAVTDSDVVAPTPAPIPAISVSPESVSPEFEPLGFETSLAVAEPKADQDAEQIEVVTTEPVASEPAKAKAEPQAEIQADPQSKPSEESQPESLPETAPANPKLVAMEVGEGVDAPDTMSTPEVTATPEPLTPELPEAEAETVETPQVLPETQTVDESEAEIEANSLEVAPPEENWPPKGTEL